MSNADYIFLRRVFRNAEDYKVLQNSLPVNVEASVMVIGFKESVKQAWFIAGLEGATHRQRHLEALCNWFTRLTISKGMDQVFTLLDTTLEKAPSVDDFFEALKELDK